MRNQRDSGGPKARVFVGAGNARRHIGRKLAFDNANMDAAFLEQPPAQHAARSAAAVLDFP